MEGVCLPTSRVAKFPAGVVQHPIAIELILGIELSLILGAIAEEMLSVILGAEVVSGEVAGGGIVWGLRGVGMRLFLAVGRLLEGVQQLNLANWRAFGLMVAAALMVEHVHWRFELPLQPVTDETVGVVV
jgi:hypothetical protein